MCASNKDLRSEIEEKEQRGIESFLEENMKNVLARSYLLVNIIFVLLGAYALILSPIFFPSSTNNSNVSIGVSSNPNSFIPNISGISSFPLILSLAIITTAFMIQLLSFDLADKNSNKKFIIKNGSLQLKYGTGLSVRNYELNGVINKQMKKNEISSSLIILSLLLFLSFMFLAKSTTDSLDPVYLFFISLFILMYFFILPHGKNKTSQIPPKNTQCKKVTQEQMKK